MYERNHTILTHPLEVSSERIRTLNLVKKSYIIFGQLFLLKEKLKIMKFQKIIKQSFILSLFLIVSYSCSSNKTNTAMNEFKPFTPPVDYAKADSMASKLVGQMTIDEKISMLGGHNMFYTQEIKRLNIPALLLSDATGGIRMLPHIKEKIGKSTAFPCPVLLAATWNPDLAYQYANSIGEECNAAGISILLGPGVNIYRVSQNGRNFEYFGEDPFLGSRMVEQYIKGIQSTGTMATLKHFLCNNHEYHRRTTNVIVDNRTLHEIYLPIFKAGVDAGAMAVMTAYNKVNGEYCGQSPFVIQQLLRKDLNFKWLVMSDWWSTFDPEKTLKSGLDLEMPGEAPKDFAGIKDLIGEPYVKDNAKKLLEKGIITESQIDRMVKSIVRTSIAMNLYNKKPDSSLVSKFPQHEEVALATAREGIVLLKNNQILPIRDLQKKILITGKFANTVPSGLGSAMVEGYNQTSLVKALQNIFGKNVVYIENPTDKDLKNADVVIVNVGTMDSEGYDRPFDIVPEFEDQIISAANSNPNTIVVINSGGGIGMTRWIDKVKGLLYAFYPGQIGNEAVAEIIAGRINPSGKLPFTIEKNFSDSPAANYIPKGQKMENTWENDLNIKLPVTNVEYKEGVLVGYRWYETKNIEPLFWFGYGLSYTTFKFSNLSCKGDFSSKDPKIYVSFTVKNTGDMTGSEVAQLYVQDVKSSVIRPTKELKSFQKISLQPGESKKIEFTLDKSAFAFYDDTNNAWKIEPGEFVVHVGSSSKDIYLTKSIDLK
jgi:beta-glucosidase